MSWRYRHLCDDCISVLAYLQCSGVGYLSLLWDRLYASIWNRHLAGDHIYRFGCQLAEGGVIMPKQYIIVEHDENDNVMTVKQVG